MSGSSSTTRMRCGVSGGIQGLAEIIVTDVHGNCRLSLAITGLHECSAIVTLASRGRRGERAPRPFRNFERTMHIIAALCLAFQAAAASPDTAHIVIVATTDVHGRALGWDYVRDAASPGGLSRAATALETLRAPYPASLVLVDAGDLLQGNPFAAFYARDDKRQPQPIVDALNALQYDAVTPGDHDFDFGLDFLRRAAGDATYHYVSANVVSDSGKTLFAPTVMLARGPIKIGITGLTTPSTNLWDRAQLGRYHVRRSEEHTSELQS